MDSFLRQIDPDTCVGTIFPLRELGLYAGFGINRQWRGRRFGERERNLLAILNCELAWFYRRLVPTVAHDPVTQHPPRLRQTLAELFAGLSEKQIARKMDVSRHTVHDYVKTLHKRFDVSNRAELLAKALASRAGNGEETHLTAKPVVARRITRVPE